MIDWDSGDYLFFGVLCIAMFLVGFVTLAYLEDQQITEENVYRVDFDCANLDKIGYESLNMTLERCMEGNCASETFDMLEISPWFEGWYMCNSDDYDNYKYLTNADMEDVMRCEYV